MTRAGWRTGWTIGLIAVIGIAVAMLSLYFNLPASGRVARIVFLEIRVPRLIVAVAGGAALAIAGLLVRRAMRNPLAVPELLGVSGGAAFATALLVTSGVAAVGVRIAGAFVGAVLGGALCLLAAARGRHAGQTLLIGAAVSTALQAGVLTVMATADQLEIAVIFKYLVGSLADVTADTAKPLLVPLLAAVLATIAVLPTLGVLSLGDAQASALGLSPGRWRLIALLLAGLLVAIVVAPAGPIAWVAFLAPTIVAWMLPSVEPAAQLAAVALVGAVVTLGADLLAREAFKPFETPLGAWTALLGFVAALGMAMNRSPA